MKLHRKNLSYLGQQPISVPAYQEPIGKPAIAHIGVGGFHRAHMARYCDLLLNLEPHSEWHICGIGVLPQDKVLQQKLLEQDCLYSLMELKEDPKVSVIGSISDFVLAPENPKQVMEILSAPETKIVSLTITESGYPFNKATQQLMKDLPDVAHDLADPDTPKTAFGLILSGLMLRKQAGLPGFTVLSCDNLPHNGDVAKKVLLAYAEHQSQDLADWVARNVTFPNSMVDRITPVTTDEHKSQLQQLCDIEDQCPVVCEEFSMWIMEDNYISGRPAWEKVGVTFTDNVVPFETMKLSLLNATHSAMAYMGLMAGFTYTYEVTENEAFCTFLQDFMDKDVTPILPNIPGIDLTEYKAQLMARFGNRHCPDLLVRLSFDGSGKLPQFLIPTIEAILTNDGDLHRVALIIASWAYYLKTRPSDQIADPRAQELTALRDSPVFYRQLLQKFDIFGDVLGKSHEFETAYLYWLKKLEETSVKDILKELTTGNYSF
ncbi:MAG: mannitol dehydrogenase family protein [Aestuariibacter sp.]